MSASFATGGMCLLPVYRAFPPSRNPTSTQQKRQKQNADTHLACRISLTFGHPYMIDIRDCDARLPSSGDPNDLYLDELVRLSVILGRVQKTIYT